MKPETQTAQAHNSDTTKQNTGSGEFASQILTEYSDLLDGLGSLHGHKYTIAIRENAQPKQNPPRSIPYKLRDKVKAELQRMQDMGVIKPVSEPTDWVNSMTIVRKPDGAVRICLDPRDLNEAIRREHFPMRTFEDISARMPKAQFFLLSKFDATSGYTGSSHWMKIAPFSRLSTLLLGDIGISSCHSASPPQARSGNGPWRRNSPT